MYAYLTFFCDIALKYNVGLFGSLLLTKKTVRGADGYTASRTYLGSTALVALVQYTHKLLRSAKSAAAILG